MNEKNLYSAACPEMTVNPKVIMSFFLCAGFSFPKRQLSAVGMNERPKDSIKLPAPIGEIFGSSLV